MSSQRWQYKNVFNDGEHVPERINYYGRKGWEAVTAVNARIVLMKRPYDWQDTDAYEQEPYDD